MKLEIYVRLGNVVCTFNYQPTMHKSLKPGIPRNLLFVIKIFYLRHLLSSFVFLLMLQLMSTQAQTSVKPLPQRRSIRFRCTGPRGPSTRGSTLSEIGSWQGSPSRSTCCQPGKPDKKDWNIGLLLISTIWSHWPPHTLVASPQSSR